MEDGTPLNDCADCSDLDRIVIDTPKYVKIPDGYEATDHNGNRLLTGQEWYDRFESLLDPRERQLHHLIDRGIGNLEHTNLDGILAVVRDVVKKASGIEQ